MVIVNAKISFQRLNQEWSARAKRESKKCIFITTSAAIVLKPELPWGF